MLERDGRRRREAIHGSKANLCDTTSGAGGSSENSNFVKYHKKYIAQSTLRLLRVESGVPNQVLSAGIL